jgi:hypothetical protein
MQDRGETTMGWTVTPQQQGLWYEARVRLANGEWLVRCFMTRFQAVEWSKSVEDTPTDEQIQRSLAPKPGSVSFYNVR